MNVSRAGLAVWFGILALAGCRDSPDSARIAAPSFAAGGVGRSSVLVNPNSNDDGTAKTIQEGIDMVAEGSKVLVLPGTYVERIVIDKGLTLEGIGDESGDVVIEQELAAPTAATDAVIRVTTPDPVVLRNITVHHVGLRGLSALTAADLTIEQASFHGVWPSSFLPVTQVFNNSVSVANNATQSGGRARLIVRDSRISTDGLGISAGGDADILIERNVIRSTGGCVFVTPIGQGVTVPAGSETNADILDNEFPECGQNRPGHNANAVNVFGTVGAGTTGTVNIVGNRFRNTIRTAGFCNTAAIVYEFFSGRIENNSIVDVIQGCADDTPAPRSRPAAIFVGSLLAGMRPANVSVRFNDISGNAFAGLRIGSNQTAVDASCNWWGSADGPSGAGLTGAGDAVVVETGGATPTLTPFAPAPIAGRGATGC